jgi:hypothetical protein
LRSLNAWKPNLSVMPYEQTILRAMSVAIAMSCAAPVDMSPVCIFSAMRPPQQTAIWSRK